MNYHKFIAIALFFTLFATPNMGAAQSIGIDFANMPVGTKASYKSHSGSKWTDTYIGKRGKKYVVIRNGVNAKGKAYKETQHYDQAGRLLSYSYKDAVRPEPGKVVYKPYMCSFQLGACKMRQKLIAHNFVNNGSNYSANYTTKKHKGGYLVSFKRSDSENTGQYFFELGQYNLRTSLIWGARANKWIKLVKIH